MNGMLYVRRIMITLLWAALLWATVPALSDDTEEPVDSIMFSHPLHVEDVEIACEDCHTGIADSDRSTDHNIPEMDICESCHDIEDDENCGMCHSLPEEPSGGIATPREISFNHRRHLANGLECLFCHGSPGDESRPYTSMPSKPLCMNCHNGETVSWDCSLCHDKGISLLDIHPVDWRAQHDDQATRDSDWCSTCHAGENFCQDCHRGDNLTGTTHGLNYRYTHGLDAIAKETDCVACHDSRTFCNECHIRELRLPWQHSTSSWLLDHGDAARRDVENCASCHDERDPTCARAGCHVDTDGIRGTNPPIHSTSLSRLDRKGPWHNDGSYFCYQCHRNTSQAGTGFCGYCHD